jgi:hypothetical protein
MIAAWWSRAAAVLAAVMLSGVPAVAAQLAKSSAASCCCPGGGHGKQCPMKKPGQSTKAPCHDAGDHGGGECSTLSGPCDAPFAPNTPPPRADEFTILQWPEVARLASPPHDVEVPHLRGDAPPPPEIPPPRRA